MSTQTTDDLSCIGEVHRDPGSGWSFRIVGNEAWDVRCVWLEGWAAGGEFTRDLMDIYLPGFDEEEGLVITRADDDLPTTSQDTKE